MALTLSADDLILFAVITEQQSFVRAAEHLRLPKATVSRRLANLEAALGQRLLLRTTRRLALTEFGREFLDHCRRVAEEAGAARDFVRSREARPRGRLRVSLPGDYVTTPLVQALASFVDSYPEVDLDLDLTPRHVDLIGEGYDLALRIGALADDSSLVVRRIDEVAFGLFASGAYLARHGEPRRPDDLLRHAAVRMLSARGTALPWTLMRGKVKWQQTPPGRFALNSPGVILQLLIAGAGIGPLPVRVADAEVGAGRLARVLPHWSLPPVPVLAVMPMRRYLPAKTRAFLAHVERFIARDAGSGTPSGGGRARPS